MNREYEETRDGDPVKWFGMVVSFLPKLLVRSGGAFLRFKRQAKKAGKVFQLELIDRGIDKKTAAELTDIYLEGSDLFRYMQYFRQ